MDEGRKSVFDFGEALAFARKVCREGDIETELTRAGLNSRLEVAKRVFWDHPQFQPVVLLCCETETAESTELIGRGLLCEAEEIQEMALDDELLQSIDYLALLAGMTAFMERFVDPRQNSARVVLAALENADAKVENPDSLALVVMACWFSDYRNFRSSVREFLNNQSTE